MAARQVKYPIVISQNYDGSLQVDGKVYWEYFVEHPNYFDIIYFVRTSTDQQYFVHSRQTDHNLGYKLLVFHMEHIFWPVDAWPYIAEHVPEAEDAFRRTWLDHADDDSDNPAKFLGLDDEEDALL